jgi:amino acid permease
LGGRANKGAGYGDFSAEGEGRWTAKKFEYGLIITILLGLILTVLLFGKGAVLTGLAWILGAAASIGAIWLAIVIVRRTIRVAGRIVRELGKDFQTQRKAGYWLSTPLMVAALPGSMIVLAAAYLIQGDGETFKQAPHHIPLWWLPVVLIMIGWPLRFVEAGVAWWRKPLK